MLEQSAYPAHTQPEELSFCEFTAASPSPLCALHTLASGLVSRPGLLQDHVTLSRALGEVTVTDGGGPSSLVAGYSAAEGTGKPALVPACRARRGSLALGTISLGNLTLRVCQLLIVKS